MLRIAIVALMTNVCATALSAPAYAQENPSAVPAFYGVWGHSRLELEPPFSGAGPVTNLNEHPLLLEGDNNNPILQPWAAEVVRRHAEIALTGAAVPNAHNACGLEGVPFVLHVAEMHILQTPDLVILLYNANHQVRYVAMNVAHSVNPEPTWYGESVGHYEGDDTLVIDTIGIKATDTTQVDRYGSPHTKSLHVVERYQLRDSDTVVRAPEPPRRRAGRVGYYHPVPGGKTMELQFIVEDQGAFTMPWGAVIHNERVRDRTIMDEHVCAENNRDFFQTELFEMPTDETPDF